MYHVRVHICNRPVIATSQLRYQNQLHPQSCGPICQLYLTVWHMTEWSKWLKGYMIWTPTVLLDVGVSPKKKKIQQTNTKPFNSENSQWYELFVTWSHAISHLGRWLLHSSLGVIKLQPRFKVCHISYDLRVLFHSS